MYPLKKSTFSPAGVRQHSFAPTGKPGWRDARQAVIHPHATSCYVMMTPCRCFSSFDILLPPQNVSSSACLPAYCTPPQPASPAMPACWGSQQLHHSGTIHLLFQSSHFFAHLENSVLFVFKVLPIYYQCHVFFDASPQHHTTQQNTNTFHIWMSPVLLNVTFTP